MFKNIFENVKSKRPLIHSITNYVTANDCANILLACGASAIMADDEQEVEQITELCDGLNINMGTLNNRNVNSMLIAGKRANALGHPVVLDLVGAGASSFRTKTANRLMEEIKFKVIKGNVSELKALFLGSNTSKGVDANVKDCITKDGVDDAVCFAKAFAKQTQGVIVITGEIDIVTDGKKTYCIRNGHPMMSFVTGTGCQLSALIAAFISANFDNTLDAVAAAVCTMGYAGQIAHSRLCKMDGNATYRNYIIDAVYNMTAKELEKGAEYEVR